MVNLKNKLLILLVVVLSVSQGFMMIAFIGSFKLHNGVDFRITINRRENVLDSIKSSGCDPSGRESQSESKISEVREQSLEQNFIYVYDVGNKYNLQLQSSKVRWWSVQYEPEYVIFDMLAKKGISRTLDPEKATLFYVPFLSARYTLMEHKRDEPSVLKEAVRKTSEAWAAIMSRIKEDYPYFNLSNGRDHFSALTMDHGRCTALTFCDPAVYGEMFFFQLNADKMVRSSHISTKRGMQALTYNYGMNVSTDLPDVPCYMADRDIAIPPMTSVKNRTEPGDFLNRPITALFRFSAGQHHGVPIPHFNHLIRKELLELYQDKGYKNWSIASKSEWESRNDWKKAKFCICPPGHSQWTSRPSKAVMSGCIPVTFYRDHDNPWKNELDHGLFSMNIDPDNLQSLKSVIDSVLAKPELMGAMMNSLQEAQTAYDWREGVINGARTHVLKALRRRAVELRSQYHQIE